MLTNDSLTQLPEYACGGKIELLDLSWCDFFTTPFLRELAQQLQLLRSPSQIPKVKIVDYYGEIVTPLELGTVH